MPALCWLGAGLTVALTQCHEALTLTIYCQVRTRVTADIGQHRGHIATRSTDCKTTTPLAQLTPGKQMSMENRTPASQCEGLADKHFRSLLTATSSRAAQVGSTELRIWTAITTLAFIAGLQNGAAHKQFTNYQYDTEASN